MEYEGLILEKKKSIAILTLNRPHRLNALTAEMSNELLPKIFKEIQDDDTVRLLIITGKGKGFCTGADVVLFNEAAEAGKLQETLEPRAQTIGGRLSSASITLRNLSSLRSTASQPAVGFLLPCLPISELPRKGRFSTSPS